MALRGLTRKKSTWGGGGDEGGVEGGIKGSVEGDQLGDNDGVDSSYAPLDDFASLNSARYK